MKRVQDDFAEVYLKFAFRNVNSAILTMRNPWRSACPPRRSNQRKSHA